MHHKNRLIQIRTNCNNKRSELSFSFINLIANICLTQIFKSKEKRPRKINLLLKIVLENFYLKVFL